MNESWDKTYKNRWELPRNETELSKIQEPQFLATSTKTSHTLKHGSLVQEKLIDLVNYGVLPNIGEYPATLLPLSIEGERQSNIFIAQGGDIACIDFCIRPRR